MRREGLRHSYDETPYRDQAFEAFDLERLLGFAELFGLRTPEASPSDSVRVLDLGCASGRHLREQATRYPDARFHGVDFSRTEIELGRKAVETSGQQNVELVCANLLEYEVEPEAYDLVLCHGVFSWVPDEVKERILMLARRAIRPGGLAAIAYLTYPGWKQIEAFRELLQMRIDPGRPPEERIRESALLLRFLRSSYDAIPNDVHARSLSATVERMQASASNAFLHDELGEVHDPCYFLQFVEWAEECGLQYLAETDLGSMRTEAAGPEARALHEALRPDFLEAQQWVDFAVNRSGRSSLLVRSDAVFDRALSGARFRPLRFGSQWWNVTPANGEAEGAGIFESPEGRRFETRCATSKRILEALTRDRTAGVPFVELESLGHGAEVSAEEALMPLVGAGIAEPRSNIRP